MKQFIFGKSMQGASHARSGTRCQDSYNIAKLDDGTIILAVADGHGSKSCPYSSTGSEVAVNVFCTVMKNLYMGCSSTPEQLLTYLNREGDVGVSMAIDTEWKKRILKLHKKNKREIIRDENGAENLNEVYKQYGSTLLGLLITNTFVFGFQLGDGDICYVNRNGIEMVIEPEKILGVETHSLSRKKSWQKAITMVHMLNIEEAQPVLFSLSTDGYINSYKNVEGFRTALSEYLNMLNEHGVEAVKSAMPEWLSETSEMGCGDDITMLIAYFTADTPNENDADKCGNEVFTDE